MCVNSNSGYQDLFPKVYLGLVSVSIIYLTVTVNRQMGWDHNIRFLNPARDPFGADIVHAFWVQFHEDNSSVNCILQMFYAVKLAIIFN